MRPRSSPQIFAPLLRSILYSCSGRSFDFKSLHWRSPSRAWAATPFLPSVSQQGSESRAMSWHRQDC